MDDATSDARVRTQIYRRFAATGRAPSSLELAEDLGASSADVEAALRRLDAEHAIVLAPGTTSVWMANPFSAVPTRFAVDVGGRSYWGNCIWDGLGIVAALGGDGTVRTACPDCDTPLDVTVSDGESRSGDGLVHFLVPARSWWDDIGFT